MDFPSIGLISNVEISHFVPSFQTESLSLIKQSKDRGLHQIKGKFDLTLVDDEVREFEAFLLLIKNRVTPFKLRLGKRFTSKTTTSKSITVNGKTLINSTSIKLNSFSGFISVGDLVSFQNDDKLYMATSKSMGGDTLNIYPPLRKEQTDTNKVSVNDVAIYATLSKDIQTISYEESGFINRITIEFEEALQ